MTDATIRLATVCDAPALQEIYTHLNPDDPVVNPAQFAKDLKALLDDGDRQIIVAELNGLIVASCTLFILPNLTRGNRPMALIENVVTHKHFRRKGLGRRVLHDGFARADKAGCYKVMLLTGSKTQGTLDFYSDVGLTQDKTGFQKRL